MKIEDTTQAKIRVHVGRLAEHGAAPNPYLREKSLSYFLVLETQFGLRPLWHDALHTALHQSRAQVGDQVTVIDRGPGAAKRKAAESSTGATAQRRDSRVPQNRWLILPAVRRLRTAAPGPQPVSMLLYEMSQRIADRYIASAEDRLRFVAMVKTTVQNVRAQEPPVGRAQAELSVSSAKKYIAQTLAARIQQLHQYPVTPTFSPAHLSKIHARLFRGLTVDAGHFRTMDANREIAKLSQTFDRCSPGSAKEGSIFASATLLRELLTRRLFDYGNLPAGMVYVEQYAKWTGFELNLFAADRQVLHSSLRDAVSLNDMTALRRILRENIRPVLNASVADHSARAHTSGHQKADAPATSGRLLALAVPVASHRHNEARGGGVTRVRHDASFRRSAGVSQPREMRKGVVYDR